MQSKHTGLINKFVGLCKRQKLGTKGTPRPWPNPLYEMGYRVKMVEQEISMRSGDMLHPDVMAASNRSLHVLVAECKSGNNINADQDRRYSNLTTADLVNLVRLHDQNQIKHDVCYVDGAENHASISPHTKLPFITFGPEHVQSHGKFKEDEINKKMSQPISLDGAEAPSSYYPFSPSDDDEFVVPHVIRAIVECVAKDAEGRRAILEHGMENNIMDLLDPQNIISSRHKRLMQKRIKGMIKTLLEHDGLGDLVKRVEDGDASIRTLSKKCEEIYPKYQTQRRITDSF